MDYEQILDKHFGRGTLWKHRTFRTVLDPLSSEYDQTDMKQKVAYLKTLVDNGVNLEYLVFDYKQRYIEQNRRDIANEADAALARIVEFLLKEKVD